MIVKGSRYERTKGFAPDGDRGLTFEGVRPRDIETPPGVLEHIVREGDRLDLLALHYYDDPGRWWRILDANPELLYGGEVDMAGQAWPLPDRDLGSLAGRSIVIPRSRGE
jgi:nucleoid-associated protein YgaU